jgi:eukaryotic-like serine/threonine-protein kinase
LLQANDEAGTFLDEFEPENTTSSDRISEGVGTTIGVYKLVEKIGKGGMGTVFRAAQSAPIRREVAIKVIKPGMDTRGVISRFAAERQALAMMDHPCIAKVLDAGATDSGGPYFVMEIVNGLAITKYCDNQQLELSERLSLFRDVCAAVQHAHQKGIIHRDIKSNNVLVTTVDGRPQVKVIDFGVAKASNQRLTEQTLITCFREVVGTPLYMSPEQANSTSQDIDTRTDVYSLGVLLYELLTGCTPFDRRRIKQAAFEEVGRIIREEEPFRPSRRLSTLAATLPGVAAMRNIEPRNLTASLRGELDWIVMKALEKDRDRRYATASAFADDIDRYLQDEPVEASPPSRTYRLRKFSRRHKRLILTAAMIFVVALTGLTLHARKLKQLNVKLEESVDELNISLAHEDRLREIANQSEQEARSLQYVSDMTLAGRAAEGGDSRLVTPKSGTRSDSKNSTRFARMTVRFCIWRSPLMADIW